MSDENELTEYFARLDREEIGPQLFEIVEDFYQYCLATNKLEQWDRMYLAANTTFTRGTFTKDVGERNEYKETNYDVIRNLRTHQMNITFAQRPAFSPRAINSDYKSQTQTLLARSILDYELDERKVEQYLRATGSSALTFGDAALITLWDKKAGPTDKEGNKQGQTGYFPVPGYDIIRDPYVRDIDELDWVIVRVYENKYDIAEQYASSENVDPDNFESEEEYRKVVNKLDEQYDEIISAEHQDSVLDGHYSQSAWLDEEFKTDLIPVYMLFHEPTPAVPNGRFVKFCCSGEVVLVDSPRPFDARSVHFMYAGKQDRSSFGYSPLFDVLSLVDAKNALHSIIETNQSAYGVQLVAVQAGAGIDVEDIEGLTFVRYDGDMVPQGVNLTKTSAETYGYLDRIDKEIQRLSGINSIVQGEAPSDYSGSALALMVTQSQQFIQQFEHSYVHCLESVGRSILDLYKQYATEPVTIRVVGKQKGQYMEQFTSEDIQDIDRVSVDIGNPMARTIGGRLAIVQDMSNMGILTEEDADKYVNILQTGTLDGILENQSGEYLLVRQENEALFDGETVQVMVTDDHKLHIMEHASMLSTPDARKDPVLAERISTHMMEHMAILQDPEYTTFLTFMGQQPLAPAPMPQLQVSSADINAQNTTAMQVPGEATLPNQPNLPRLPEGVSSTSPVPAAGVRDQ